VVERNLASPEGNRPQSREFERVEETAKRWRTSPRTVYRLVEQGMPAIRLGPRILRFDPEAVDRWLAERASP
jgi:excisionase family DNA binding protein